jgi:MvaI/BcnI restriction endonuclease family
LGIRPNGFSEPDFHGWEIKQHAVTDLAKLSGGGPITLMTPEPTGGVYAICGVQEFIRRFGYPDQKVQDRLNFGGVHNASRVCTKTGLSLSLAGYDLRRSKITDPAGGISLLTAEGEAAAVWPYPGLLAHWNRKHARAAYVPSIVRETPMRQYRYGGRVRLGIGTDFLLFLKAVALGAVYYDPGIKMEQASTPRPRIKRRSQFRIKSARIPLLYRDVEELNLT